jgi:hypothetical protein
VAGVSLELLGLYAGAVGERSLEDLRLGRAFPINLVEDLLRQRERGRNPFPPALVRTRSTSSTPEV